jgi:valyl-tRNA synthetase
LLKLDVGIQEINRAFNGYEFNQVTSKIYELFWTDYCDWYLEASKAAFYGTDEQAKNACLATMDVVLNYVLRLLHPFMPFITEELWQALGFARNPKSGASSQKEEGSIQFAEWPKGISQEEKTRLKLNADVLEFVGRKYEAVSAGRNLKASYNINKKVRFFMKPEGTWSSIPQEVQVFKTLLNAESLEFVSDAPKGTASAVTALGIIYLPLEGLVDVEAETKRLNGQIGKLEKELEQVNAKLADPGFTTRAPKEAVEKHRVRAEALQADIEKIRKQIASLG